MIFTRTNILSWLQSAVIKNQGQNTMKTIVNLHIRTKITLIGLTLPELIDHLLLLLLCLILSYMHEAFPTILLPILCVHPISWIPQSLKTYVPGMWSALFYIKNYFIVKKRGRKDSKPKQNSK